MLKENLENVEQKIQAACERSGRDRSEVTLIAVSKTKPAEMVQEAYDLGIRLFGENKVQEIMDKSEVLPDDIHWHMIGHLQRNKIKYIIDKVDLIHSVDSLRLAEAIEKEAAKKALFEKIEVGQTVTGVVKSVVDFGAFIDIGGADGLLHISEMSWGRVGNPRKLFKPGDEVTAFIKEINGDKIALSLKFEDTNPWANASEKFAVGVVVTGKVARMTDFGAFVEIEPGVDALLHVSQIANHHVDKPSDELTIGQEIEAKIVDFNEEEKKISLSMKALLPQEDETDAEEVEETTEE